MDRLLVALVRALQRRGKITLDEYFISRPKELIDALKQDAKSHSGLL